jgi:hypothetical protein
VISGAFNNKRVHFVGVIITEEIFGRKSKSSGTLRHYQSFVYSPTDAQVSCLNNNFKMYIKIDIKTAPTCLGAVIPSSGSALLRAY